MNKSSLDSKFNVGIIGTTGKMGKKAIEIFSQYKEFDLSGYINSDHPDLKTDLGIIANINAIDRYPKTSLNNLITDSSIIIDFSHPTLTLKTALLMEQHSDKIYIVGTTNLNDKIINTLKLAANNNVVIQDYNMSLGVYFIKKIINNLTSSDLLHNSFNTQLIEEHHRNKKDSPSGTAKDILASLPNNTEVISHRRDDLKGKHSIKFFNNNEEILIQHTSNDRNIYIQGAIQAIFWIINNNITNGLYHMKHIYDDLHNTHNAEAPTSI